MAPVAVLWSYDTYADLILTVSEAPEHLVQVHFTLTDNCPLFLCV